MTKQVVADKFSPAKQDEKRTTRFYGVKFLEKRLNDEQHYYSTTPATGQQNFLNPREYFREVYGPFLCSLLVTSAITVVIGSALALAGYYVPQLSIKRLVSDKYTEAEAIKKAQRYDDTLQGLRIAGIFLLAIGGLGLSFLIVAPMIFLRRTEYTVLPSYDSTNTMTSPVPVHISPATTSKTSTASNRTTDFKYSVVKKHVQPSTNRKQTKRMSHHRASYDKGFLSPDLNRGTIFISDNNYQLSDQERRIRSASCGMLSSPSSTRKHRTSSFNKGIETKRIPVKAGSFHSLLDTE